MEARIFCVRIKNGMTEYYSVSVRASKENIARRVAERIYSLRKQGYRIEEVEYQE